MGRKQRKERKESRNGGNPQRVRALGVDIGRVIIKPAQTEADTSFLHGDDDDAMQRPANLGAFETIAALVQAFEGRVWLISKCGPRIQARSRLWLAHHRFFERTGVPHRQLSFCRKRGEKAPLCAKFGIDAFIDDRFDVLAPMEGVVRLRYLFGPQKSERVPAGVLAVRDWTEVAADLLPRVVSPG